MIRNVYVHIPFCFNICSYCDFSKVYYNEEIADNYLISLEKEIAIRYKNEVVDTIYIGGGSPSSLNIEQLKKLFKIINNINKSNECSITFECNSDDLTFDKIEVLANNGVNRVSIGVQSFDDKILNVLNRNSNYNVVKNVIDLLNEKEIIDINVDLIYGINIQTKDDLVKDLEKMLSLNITHISTYSLILEKNTFLFNKKYQEIDDDLDYEMYKYINKTLLKEGFINYEISNYCRKKNESKHNLCYWNNEQYYGFGVGASSYIEDVRFFCVNNIKKYIDCIYNYEKEELNIEKKEEYEFILGFRKIEGINKDNFLKKFNKNILDNEVVVKLLKEKKLLQNDSNLFINPKYIYVSNEILLEFIK